MSISDDPNKTSLGSTSQYPADGSSADFTDDRRALRPDEAQAVESLPEGSALLIALSGANEGARFLLNKDVTNAGRQRKTDIFLDDFTVSRRHAQFIRENGVFSVRDSGSLNGTYVNRERIDSAMLSNGDEVQIGKFRLSFYVSQA